MNKEVIKAMNRKPTEHKFRKWWNNNKHIIMRIIFFPIWIVVLIVESSEKRAYKREKWNEVKAAEILDYYIPRRAEWDEETKSFYLFDNGYGWGSKRTIKTIKRKDRKFWKVNNGWSGGKIRTFLIEEYELEGFEKTVGDCSDSWTEITFTLIEKN